MSQQSTFSNKNQKTPPEHINNESMLSKDRLNFHKLILHPIDS